MNYKLRRLFLSKFELKIKKTASRGQYLSLVRPDESGTLEVICDMPMFGIIRSIQPLRLTGDTKDYVVMGSESGCIVILEYNVETAQFIQVHCETFGKTGMRRITPGEYLAVDPQGRAVMIAALEKQKLVYVTNRDAAARLTISSPLEAHKSHILVYDLKAVDVGYDNPLFAAIGVDYDDVKKAAAMDPEAKFSDDMKLNPQTFVDKSLVYYEFDLGLNHVIRKSSEKIDYFSSHLVSVPGGEDEPSGVLVCSRGIISYRKLDHAAVNCRLPVHSASLKSDINEQDLMASDAMIVASSVHRQKDLIFILIQNELGDLFQIDLIFAVESDLTKVTELKATYFDTIPVAKSLCITKKGLLFAALETGSHILYQIVDNIEDLNSTDRNLTTVTSSSYY